MFWPPQIVDFGDFTGFCLDRDPFLGHPAVTSGDLVILGVHFGPILEVHFARNGLFWTLFLGPFWDLFCRHMCISGLSARLCRASRRHMCISIFGVSRNGVHFEVHFGPQKHPKIVFWTYFGVFDDLEKHGLWVATHKRDFAFWDFWPKSGPGFHQNFSLPATGGTAYLGS